MPQFRYSDLFAYMNEKGLDARPNSSSLAKFTNQGTNIVNQSQITSPELRGRMRNIEFNIGTIQNDPPSKIDNMLIEKFFGIGNA